MEAGWEEARRAREAEWHERLAAAEEARVALQSRCGTLEGWLEAHQGALDGAGDNARIFKE